MRRSGFWIPALWLLVGLTSCVIFEPSAAGPALDPAKLASRLRLETRVDEATKSRISRGTYTVFEDREAGRGRRLKLEVVVLHTLGANSEPDPVFIFGGGPGEDITQSAEGLAKSWMREKRDIVLVSQRGTGGEDALRCTLPYNEDNPQGYLETFFDPEALRACLAALLRKGYDLTKYSTFLAMDDVNEVRAALGYRTINLVGGSYGSRAALIYMKRHPETVRSAILMGVAPVAFTIPLYHAPGAQEALDLIFAECANNPDCRAAFPNLEEEFWAVMVRLQEGPVEVTITHPKTQERIRVKLSKDAFAESVRTMMYGPPLQTELPSLIHRAFQGDYETFAQAGIRSNKAIRDLMVIALNLCVTCAEDVSRIVPDEIPGVIGHSFAGETRVRDQRAVCEFWPKSDLPPDFGEPVSVNVPVLLMTGRLDPVTPPRWGDEAASHLPSSLHLVVPGGHAIGGPCVEDIMRQFLGSASLEGLDTSCTATMTLPLFKLGDK